jgi:hypothetical protein
LGGAPLKVKVAREEEGVERKGEGRKDRGKRRREKGRKINAFPLNLPQYSLQLLYKRLSDASFCAGADAYLRMLVIYEEPQFFHLKIVSLTYARV